LLNPAHPDNAGKAAFFFSLGFNPDEWAVVARHSTTWRKQLTSPAAWNLRTGRSMLWTARSNSER
jgi:hypothetical protein